jgi:hypothetical protein
VFQQGGAKPGKTLVESASAIYDTSYLRYAQQGIPNVSPGFVPALRYTLRWVKFGLAVGGEICERQ